MSARLSAADLACRRGERALFAGLSLELAPGDVLQVAGPNGVGKSSLLRILAGLLRPLAGTVERKGTIGLIDEHPALDEHRPLGKALDFWRVLDRMPDTPRPWSLEPLLDVPVRYLSTGQRKRAAFARLAAQGAEIWLLDEPLNGLDPSGTAQIEQLLRDHSAAGGIAVVASHQAIALPGGHTLAIADFGP